MSRIITGPIKIPNGTQITSGEILFRAYRHNYSADGTVPIGVTASIDLTGGSFAQEILNGDYQVLYILPNNAGKIPLGHVVVEDGGSITLGELIDISRNKTADWSISADFATKSYVHDYVNFGATAYDVDIADLNPGSATPLQLWRVAANGIDVESFTLNINHVNPVGMNNGQQVYVENGAFVGKTAEVYKIIASPYAALAEEKILLRPSDNITLPTANDGDTVHFSSADEYAVTPRLYDEFVNIINDEIAISNIDTVDWISTDVFKNDSNGILTPQGVLAFGWGRTSSSSGSWSGALNSDIALAISQTQTLTVLCKVGTATAGIQINLYNNTDAVSNFTAFSVSNGKFVVSVSSSDVVARAIDLADGWQLLSITYKAQQNDVGDDLIAFIYPVFSSVEIDTYHYIAWAVIQHAPHYRTVYSEYPEIHASDALIFGASEALIVNDTRSFSLRYNAEINDWRLS